jgi:hypothetical protein
MAVYLFLAQWEFVFLHKVLPKRRSKDMTQDFQFVFLEGQGRPQVRDHIELADLIQSRSVRILIFDHIPFVVTDKVFDRGLPVVFDKDLASFKIVNIEVVCKMLVRDSPLS